MHLQSIKSTCSYCPKKDFIRMMRRTEEGWWVCLDMYNCMCCSGNEGKVMLSVKQTCLVSHSTLCTVTHTPGPALQTREFAYKAAS